MTFAWISRNLSNILRTMAMDRIGSVHFTIKTHKTHKTHEKTKNAAQTGGVELFARYILISAGWGDPPE